MAPVENVISIARHLGNVANDNFATNQEQTLNDRLEKMDSVRRIRMQHLVDLRRAFSDASSVDPYYISPTYYGLTGRRGLWVYNHDENNALIFCLHPNKTNTVVVFPPFGDRPEAILTSFFDAIADVPVHLEIGRVPEDNLALKHMISEKLDGIYSQEVEEGTLDWKFPVHTASCKFIDEEPRKERSDVLNPDLKHLRYSVGYIKRHYDPFETRSIDFNDKNDIHTLSQLARSWESSSNKRHDHKRQYDLNSDYFDYLAQMARHTDLGIRGLIIKLNGRDVGFSIWEPPSTAGNTANLFANQVTDFSIKNLPTYLLYKTAKRILKQGGQFLCLGGSETQGQDFFKRKFAPVMSTPMKTLEIIRSLRCEIDLADVQRESVRTPVERMKPPEINQN